MSSGTDEIWTDDDPTPVERMRPVADTLARDLGDLRSELVAELEAADAQRQRVARLLQRADLMSHEHKRQIAERDQTIALLRSQLEDAAMRIAALESRG